jgi:hypothetical protein
LSVADERRRRASVCQFVMSALRRLRRYACISDGGVYGAARVSLRAWMSKFFRCLRIAIGRPATRACDRGMRSNPRPDLSFFPKQCVFRAPSTVAAGRNHA